LVDPRDYRENRWHGDLANESFGVLDIGVEKDDSALFSDRFGPAVVDVGGGGWNIGILACSRTNCELRID
jgi:hypothetical protein